MATLTSKITHPKYVGQRFDDAFGEILFDVFNIELVCWDDWETAEVSGRGFDPECAILHWAASADGRDGGLPKFCADRVLCHFLLSGELHGQDQRRRVYLFSQGRTGHAGQCSSAALDILSEEGPFPYERWPNAGGGYEGYYRSVGMEVTASGSNPYPEWLFDGQFQTYAAMFFLFGWDAKRLGTHAQITSRKVDTPDSWGPPNFDPHPWPQAGAPASGNNQAQVAKWLDHLRRTVDGDTPTEPDKPLVDLCLRTLDPIDYPTGWDVDLVRREVAGYNKGQPYSNWFAQNKVVPWQEAHGLEPDGVFGPKSWTELLAPQT